MRKPEKTAAIGSAVILPVPIARTGSSTTVAPLRGSDVALATSGCVKPEVQFMSGE